MKKLLFTLLLVSALASSAFAGQIQVGYPGSGYGPYQTGQGGEFTLVSLNAALDLSHYANGMSKNVFGAPVDSFQSFCIEGNELIYPYGAIYNEKIDTFAEAGGMSGQDESGRDHVSVGSGWLYSQFALGTLNYNYVGNRGASADLLQKALWWLEGEEGVQYDANNIYMAAVTSKFGSAAGAMANGGETYGVYALNIWDQNGLAQSQLIYVPDGGASLTLLGGALMVLGALRRKIRA
jgi:hypothetical protein